MRYFPVSLFLTPLMAFRPAAAQRLALSGQVVEATSGEPVPFASVFVPGTSQGATADGEGNFQLGFEIQPIRVRYICRLPH